MVSDEQAEAIIKLAADSGINLFDLSEAHSGIRAELELGRIIQKYNWKRTSYIIVTKIYWSTKSEERGLSRKHIIESVKASLQRLKVDYIDIILVHKADAMCPMEGNLCEAKRGVLIENKCLSTPCSSRNDSCHELRHQPRLVSLLGHSKMESC
jgi:aryl-alcohol dehydrogenase-like predicted oxidoreductase